MGSKILRMSIAAAAIVIALTGCSSHHSGGNFPPPGGAMASGQQSGPHPDMDNCTLINSGSPTKYVCNGKQYTTFDLYRLRQNNKNVGGGPSETILQPGSKQQ